MTTITRQQIKDRLQVSDFQIERAEYSGLIPESKTGVWELSRIEALLNHWEAKLSRGKLKFDSIQTIFEFPKHQR